MEAAAAAVAAADAAAAATAAAVRRGVAAGCCCCVERLYRMAAPPRAKRMRMKRGKAIEAAFGTKMVTLQNLCFNFRMQPHTVLEIGKSSRVQGQRCKKTSMQPARGHKRWPGFLSRAYVYIAEMAIRPAASP